MQNGHWIPRNNLATRFSEDNCRPQCLTKESKLRLSDGSERSIADIQIGDCLHGFDEETFANKESVVLQKQSFLPEKLYKVELENGQSFFATGDHKIVANGKWYSVASMLHDCNAYDILEK